MRGLLTSLPSQSLYWVMSNVVGMGKSFQDDITAFEKQTDVPTSKELLSDDSGYQAYAKWRDYWLHQLNLLQKILLQYPISLTKLDQALGTQWTYLFSEEAGFSPFDYQLGLKWLEQHLKSRKGMHYTPVLQYHQKAVLDFIAENAEDPSDFFRFDLINHLYRYSLDQSSYDTIMELLAFYKSVVTEELFDAIEKVVTEKLEQSRLNDEEDYVAQLIGKIDVLFDEAQQSFEQESVQEDVTIPPLSSQQSVLKQLSLAFIQGVHYIRKHPVGAVMMLLVMRSHVTAAQNPFLVNSDLTGTQQYPTVDAFSSNGFVVGFEDVRFNTSSIFARTFDNNGIPRFSDFALGNGTNPIVATFPDDTFVAAWEDEQSVVARRSNGSDPIGLAFLLTGSSEPQRNPSLVTQLGNAFVATWEQFGPSGWNVYSRSFDSNDMPMGPAFQISSASSSTLRNPSSAASSTNEIVTVFESNGQGEVDYTGSTNIGDMTSGGGLQAAFDRDTDQGANSAIRSGAVINAFVGKDWVSTEVF